MVFTQMLMSLFENLLNLSTVYTVITLLSIRVVSGFLFLKALVQSKIVHDSFIETIGMPASLAKIAKSYFV